MARNLRKTLKKRKSLKKIRGGGECNCGKDVSMKPLIGGGKCGQAAAYSAGGGKRRKFRRSRRYSKKSRKTRRKTNKRRVKGGSGTSVIGGIVSENANRLRNLHGYTMWENAGPLESQGSGLTKAVLNAQTYKSGNPLEQPVSQKYGDHNRPLV